MCVCFVSLKHGNLQQNMGQLGRIVGAKSRPPRSVPCGGLMDGRLIFLTGWLGAVNLQGQARTGHYTHNLVRATEHAH